MCQAFYQVAVDAGANAKAEEIAVFVVIAYQIERFVFYIYKTICGQNQRTCKFSTRSRNRVGFAQGSQQFGAAATVLFFDHLYGLFDVFAGGIYRPFAHGAGIACKQYHVEFVGSTKSANQIAQQAFGNIDRKTIHRSGNVHHKNILAGRNVFVGDAFGRLHHQHKEVLVAVIVEHNARFNFIPSQRIIENHIAVAAVGFRLVEFHYSDGRSGVTHLHQVRIAGDVFCRNGTIDLCFEAKFIQWCFAFGGVGRSNKLVVGCAVFGAAIAVSRPHHGRIYKAILAFFGHQQFGIFQFHHNGIVHGNVGHPHRKYIGAVLFQ